MPDEVTSSPVQGTEAATGSEAPIPFREYAKWRATGELPEQKEETPPAAAAEKPPAKTEPDSETDATQEAGEEDEPQESDEGAPAGKGKGGSRQRRIDRLTREVEELKRQIAGAPVKPQDKPLEPAKSVPTGKPKLEDFQTLESYQEALTDWKLDERERLQKEQQARASAEEAIRTEQDGWAKKEKAARKAHDDYDDLMETVRIPAGPGVLAARQAMLEDENGAELLYYLAKNPKELERIAALPPASAVMAVGRLSATFEKSPAAPENGKPRITGAPKPPPPSGRAGKTASDDPNDPDVQKDFKRWAKAREAQLKGR
jgi:hypothetical protein